MEVPDDLVRREDLDELRQQLVKELRIEMMAAHLGDDKIISEEEAAQLLGISKRTLYRMRQRGEVHAGTIAGRPRYSLGQIRRLMRETVRAE